MDFSNLLNQTITYWAPSSYDKFGVGTYDDPVTVIGRWEDKQELFIDVNGKEVRSSSIVYLEDDVETGGYLYLGESTETTPIDETGAREIRGYAKTPSLDAVYFLRKIWL